jgi:hypothetical protein
LYFLKVKLLHRLLHCTPSSPPSRVYSSLPCSSTATPLLLELLDHHVIVRHERGVGGGGEPEASAGGRTPEAAEVVKLESYTSPKIQRGGVRRHHTLPFPAREELWAVRSRLLRRRTAREGEHHVVRASFAAGQPPAVQIDVRRLRIEQHTVESMLDAYESSSTPSNRCSAPTN